MYWSNVLVKCNVKIYYSFVPILVFLASTPFQPYSTLVPFHLSDGPPSLLVMSRPSSGVEFSSSPLNETTAPLLTSLQSEHCLCSTSSKDVVWETYCLGEAAELKYVCWKVLLYSIIWPLLANHAALSFMLRAAQIMSGQREYLLKLRLI